MFRSFDVNRFVFDEFKNKDTQDKGALVMELYNRRSSNKFRRFYMWLCRKRINKSLISFLDLGLINVDAADYNKFNFTTLAKDIVTPQTHGTPAKDKLLDWSYAVGDKQYFLYSWNDAKVSGLITVDAALMAGILFVLQLLDFSSLSSQTATQAVGQASQTITQGTGLYLGIFPLLLFATSFVLLSLSIIFCLVHTIPKLNSKMGNGHNLKTMIGINRYRLMQNMLGGKKHFSAEAEYFKNVQNFTEDDLLEMNVLQIMGMNTNNIKSHKIIRKGVITTIISIIVIIIAIIAFSIQNII